MAEEKKPKDFWDKVSIVLHPMGGLLTALAVTYVGMKLPRPTIGPPIHP